jgi:cell division GTPase FtsZ
MEKSIKVMLIVTGVQSSQILGSDMEKKSQEEQLESELGIKFVND